MPGGDRTGPLGEGPRTGRGMGVCTGNDAPGYLNPPFGRFGWGGRGWRRGFAGWGRPRFGGYYQAAALTPEQELEELKKESGFLKQRLDAVNDWISRIEKK